ncbi:MAG TPA: YciI family protein [Gaiellaceae bacterium]|nr:YciI family protein [Gaiellaceae bacterium]
MEFDRHTIVLLVRPADAPELPHETRDALQDEHLANQAELHERGLVVAAGPFIGQDDDRLRGIAVLSVDAAEARRLYSCDPAVVAGQLSIELMTWLVPAGSITFESVAFPHSTLEATGGDAVA